MLSYGARRKVDDHIGGGTPVKTAEAGVILRAELYPPNVAHAQQRSIRLRADYDVAKLGRIRKPARGRDGILEIRTRRRRRLADGARRVLPVLRLNGA